MFILAVRFGLVYVVVFFLIEAFLHDIFKFTPRKQKFTVMYTTQKD